MKIGRPRLKSGDVVIERYRIDGEIGQGGMQQVFRATDLSLRETRERGIRYRTGSGSDGMRPLKLFLASAPYRSRFCNSEARERWN